MSVMKGLRATLCALAIGTLCVFPAAAKKSEVVPTQALAATHGYVFASFPKGGADILRIAPAAGGKPIELTLRNGSWKPASYGAWVPAGTYHVVKWGPYGWTDTSTFDVQPGRITDLGGLISIGIGGYKIVFVPTHQPEYANDVQSAIDEYAGLLASREPIVWAPTTPMKPILTGPAPTGLGLVADMMQAYSRKLNRPSIAAQLEAAPTYADFLRLARTITPPLYDEPALTPDGTMYFTADFGQLRRRAPSGEWTSVGQDTLAAISSVEYADGALVTGSDLGVIRRSTDDGKTWTQLAELERGENILDIDHDATQWLLLTARFAPDATSLQRHLLLSVYRAQGADLHDLARVREIRVAIADQVGWLGARGQLVAGDYTITVPPDLLRLDTKTMAWKTISPAPGVHTHRVDPTTGTMTALHAQGVFSKLWVSQDRGETWKQIGRPPYHMADVQMDSATEGWALRLNMDAFTSRWAIYTYDAAIDDWRISAEAPHLCKPVRAGPTLPVICIAPDASIFWRDGTNGWKVEFSAQ